MATAEQHLAPLSAAERQQLESWLADFGRAWDEGLLARRAQELPPGDRLRTAALIEMVKIDLERRWQGGRQALLEYYLRAHPELGAADGAVAVLLRAEYAARSRLGASPTSAELLRRFPNLAGVIRQLTARPAGSASGAPRPAPPTRETMHSAASTPSVAPRSAAGRSLPEQFGARYRIVKKLGRGGMGTVYLARDTQLDRPVALKVPHFSPEDGPEGLQRFYQEARIAATLDHPNICPIYDVGELGGVPYLTMKCVVGKPLTDYVRPDRPLPQAQAAALVRKVALALQAAHARGIVHRDLKPSNIMIHRGGEPMVMDFGLAGRPHREGSARLTRSGTPLGTPAYMAPEQARGDTRELGPACDVYSLGVVLYELLTGRPPFEGPVFAVLAMVLTQEPTPAAQLRPELDPRLAAVCRKAMAKKAEDRYPSMGAFVEALESYLRQRDRPAPARRLPYLPALAGAAGGLLVVLLVVVGVLLSLSRRTPAARTEREAPVAVATPVAAPPTTAPASPPPALPSTAAAPVVKPADPPAPARPKPAAVDLSLEECLPDDTVMVLTVNVRQVLDAAVVRKYLGPRLDKLLKANLLLTAAWNAASFDPLKDVASLRMAFTAVSTPNVKMLVISQGHFDRARLEAMWAAGGKLHEVPDGAGGSFRVYEVADGPQGQTMYYAFLGESAFAVGTDIGHATEALAKQARRRQTVLKDATLRRLLPRVDERASLCLAVTGGLKNEHGQTLREASGCESFVASLTLADDLRGQVTCAVANRAAAEKLNGDVTAELVKASVQLTLEAEKNPELAPLLDVLKSIKGTVDDNAVTIRGRVPAAVLDRVLAGKEVDEVFQKAAEELTRLQGPAQEVRQAVQFNDALVEAQRKVGDAADKVHRALQGLDAAAGAKKAAVAFRKTYDEVQAQLARLQPPPGKSTKAFQDALQRLLQEQARVVDEDMAQLRLLEGSGRAPDVMMAELEEHHTRKARSVGGATQTFVDAQKVFARDHNITLR